MLAGTGVRTIRSDCSYSSPFSEESHGVTNEMDSYSLLGLEANHVSVEGVIIAARDGVTAALKDQENIGTDLHTGLYEDFEGVWQVEGELRIALVDG